MSREKIIKHIKKARFWLGFLLGAGEITEELAWSFAPNQGIFRVFHSSGSLGVFESKFLNTNRVALPFLALQGIAYLSDAALLFSLAALEDPDTPAAPPSPEKLEQLKSASMGKPVVPTSGILERSVKPPRSGLENSETFTHEVFLKPLQATPMDGTGQTIPAGVEKPNTSLIPAVVAKTKTFVNYNKRLMKGFVSLMGAFLIAALMIAIFIATVKTLIIAYCVQSAVEIGLIGHKIGQSVQRFFAAKKAIKHTEGTNNIKSLKLHQDRKLEAQQEITKQTTKFGFATLIVGLTVLSFLPVPFLAQAAQVSLALIAIGFMINLGIDRYKKYKALKAKAELAAVDPNTKSQGPPDIDHTPKPGAEERIVDILSTENDESKNPLLPIKRCESGPELSRTVVEVGLAPEKPPESGVVVNKNTSITADNSIETSMALDVLVKPLESCVSADKNISITASSVVENNAPLNAVTETPVVESISEKSNISAPTFFPVANVIHSKDLGSTDLIKDDHSASTIGNKDATRQKMYIEVYTKKCTTNKSQELRNQQQWQKLRQQQRNAERRGCQPIESRNYTIAIPAIAVV